MEYPKNVNNYKYHGVVNHNVLCNIWANDMSTLKRLASEHANPYYKVIDKLIVFDVSTGNKMFEMQRYNKKSPNNEIIFGKWS